MFRLEEKNMNEGFLNKLGFYVYVLVDSSKPGKFSYSNYTFDYEPFYVGKGSNARVLCHFRGIDLSQEEFIKKHSTNKGKNKRIWNINKDGFQKCVYILEDNLTEEESFNLEKRMIQAIGRLDMGAGPLLNRTDGGEGSANVSQELRDFFSKKYTGAGNPFYNKKHTEETKLKISNSRKGTPAWNKNIKRTEEEKALMSKVHKERNAIRKKENPNIFSEWMTEDARKKISESNKGLKNGMSCVWVLLDKKENIDIIVKGGIKEWCKNHETTYTRLIYGHDRYIIKEKIPKNEFKNE